MRRGVTCWGVFLLVVLGDACLADTVTMTSGRTVEAALDKVRASEKEIAQITVERPEPARNVATRMTPAAPRPTLAGARQSSEDQYLGWSSGDMGYARRSNATSSGGGRVYVRSYFRKDGTYVSAHTRRR
jgi:hypothetical protein